MISLPSFDLCLIISLTWTAAGLHSNDQLLFAIKGDQIILPCGLPNIESCSRIKWNVTERYGLGTEVVKNGRVTNPKADRHRLLKDCSLKITDLVLDDAKTYSCESGNLNSSVSLRILEITETQQPNNVTELQCYLNMFTGYMPCNDTRLHMTWTSEDDTPINGKRFTFKSETACFSKLFITKKLTDHHRTWKCHVFQNDKIKATASHTTTVRGGLEEVFGAVGESVSLICRNTSSLGLANIKWAVIKTAQSYKSSDHDNIKEFLLDKDSSLVISKLSPLHARDYQCSESNGQKGVFNRIRLHTLDVTEKSGPDGKNLTFVCVLTCAEECEEDFNLAWSGTNQEGWQSRLMNVSNTLVKELILPAWPAGSDEIACSVYREGALMISKKWRLVSSLQTLTWLGLPLGLLVCTTGGGLYMYMKRKHNINTAQEQSDVAMTHIYDVIQEEEPEGQKHFKRETSTKVDGFYDLLEAVE